MKIRVTKKDINNGLPLDPCHCPIAKAIRRALHLKPDDALCVAVGRHTIELDKFAFHLPQEARRWAEDFDAGRKVKPFQFDLDLKAKREYNGRAKKESS